MIDVWLALITIVLCLAIAITAFIVGTMTINRLKKPHKKPPDQNLR